MNLMNIQRAVLVVKPENFDKARAFYSELLNLNLEEVPGGAAHGVRAVWDPWGGLEIISPFPDTTVPSGLVYSEFLKNHGEGLMAVSWVPEDMAKARAKRKEMGVGVIEEFDLDSKGLKAIGADRLFTGNFLESVYKPEFGFSVVFNKFELTDRKS